MLAPGLPIVSTALGACRWIPDLLQAVVHLGSSCFVTKKHKNKIDYICIFIAATLSNILHVHLGTFATPPPCKKFFADVNAGCHIFTNIISY